MILILGDKSDYCLNMVLDWLDYFESNYVLLSNSSSITIKRIRIENNELEFFVNDRLINLRNISSIFNWRGKINFKVEKYLLSEKKLPVQVREHLNMELISIKILC